ncbi:hypothetical protein BU24DRAFT_192791 [Aaosphaeria arxii CBS 175.79]|uniref:3'-5' exonuclease domain-containing protein n=1 Tax=Aaosphaeria arxii CBS 175.79 TaxID=1450172 RepID=A0A6A5XSC2_9PLEO|nr:uncharacterized protein BU24DRAFT_192791 [Aaosphaeria arxii CBS 175.79]KAF2016072.1 hypothetical protein BU24DRAFT_192791 [Aaosphaeria arxii CBS 175.79]
MPLRLRGTSACASSASLRPLSSRAMAAAEARCTGVGVDESQTSSASIHTPPFPNSSTATPSYSCFQGNRIWTPADGILFATKPQISNTSITNVNTQGRAMFMVGPYARHDPTHSQAFVHSIESKRTNAITINSKKCRMERPRFALPSPQPTHCGSVHSIHTSSLKAQHPARFPIGSGRPRNLSTESSSCRSPISDVDDPGEARVSVFTGSESATTTTGPCRGTLDTGVSRPQTDDSEITHTSVNPDSSVMPDPNILESKESSFVISEGADLLDDAENMEEHAPLSFQIPADTLREKMQVSPRVGDRYWSHKLYRGLNDESLLIHYCKTFEIAEHVAKYFLQEKVIGFDIEWKPFGRADSIKENASLIQLACEGRIALFHLALFDGTAAEQLLPPSLKAVIESPNVLKVGVAIKADFTRLQKYLNVEPLGVFELSRLHNLVENFTINHEKAGSKKHVGLAAQVQQHLQLPLEKGDVRHSDWSKLLTPSQIEYAAADAYAGFRLFDALDRKRKLLKPIPPRPLLCDFDPKATPSRRRARRKRSTKVASDDRQDESEGLVAEEGEDAEEYAAVAEDFQGCEDSTSAPQTTPSTMSPSVSLVQKDSHPPEKNYNASIDQQQTRHIGRIKMTAYTDGEVVYPSLPMVGSDVTNMLDFPATLDPSTPSQVHDRAHEAIGIQSPHDGLSWGKGAHQSSNGTLENGNPATANPVEELKHSEIQSPRSASGLAFKPLMPSAKNDRSSEYNLAEDWAQSYLYRTIPLPTSTTTARIRATVPLLRAYHLWYHQSMTPDAISRQLRDPPLAISTVSSYILQAVTIEKLAYRNQDMRDVLNGIPVGLRMTRWKWLVDKLGGV